MATVSEPCWKQPFATEQLATESAELMNAGFKQERQAHRRRVRMRVYCCPLCRQWHLTKQKQRHARRT